MNQTLPIDYSKSVQELNEENSIVKQLNEHDVKSLIREENMVSPWLENSDP